MISGTETGRIVSMMLLLGTLLLAACDDDANSFQSLPVGATATNPDAAPAAAPVRVMVVGDVASPTLANLLSGRNFEVTDIPFDTGFAAGEVAMAGDYIVWSDNRNGNQDIYGYRISTATEFPISTAAGRQALPQIAGDYVVWEDYRAGNADIYAYRLSTGTGFAITTAPHNQRYPRIDGDYVVWQDGRAGNADIYAYRLSTGEELAISTAADNQWYPQIAGDHIVWQSYLSGSSDIRGYRISTAAPLDISLAAGSQYAPMVSDRYVVWVDNRSGSDDIYAYDLGSGQEIVVSAAANQQLRPQVSGDYAVWQDFRNGSDYDIYVYHFPSATEIPVAVAAGDQSAPLIRGDLIVWQDKRSGISDIYAYRLSDGATIRVTDRPVDQHQPVLSADRIAWLDGRRGLVDVMFRAGATGTDQVATRGWPTPAGITDFGDHQVLLLGSDIVSEEAVLELFDAAVAAGVAVLGLGGNGISLAGALANAGRYGISVTPDAGCSAMQIVALDSDHALFSGLNTAAVIRLENNAAETRDELAITTDASAPGSPMDWRRLASFSSNMCNASAPAVVEFSVDDTRVLLDGSAGVADAYAHWNDARWTLLTNALTHLAE